MARIRSIKPDYWKSERLATRLPGPDGREARRLFIALWNFAEDHGVCRGSPAYLRSEAYAYDEDVTTADVARWLEMLEVGGFIVRYQRDGSSYLWVRGFAEHQKIDRPSKTTLPEPSHEEREHCPSPRRALAEPSLLEGKGREGTGKEEESASQAVAVAPPEDLPDATEHATEVTDCQQEGHEKASGSPAIARNDAPSTRVAPPLSLVAQEPGKKPRKPSKAEALYAKLEEARRERCDEVGAVFVALEWSPARINAQLGSLARVQGEEAERMSEAFALFLEDEKGAAWNPPWDLGMFLVRRAEYVSRALRAAGGMT